MNYPNYRIPTGKMGDRTMIMRIHNTSTRDPLGIPDELPFFQLIREISGKIELNYLAINHQLKEESPDLSVIKTSLDDIRVLNILVKDLSTWIFTDGSTLMCKYEGTYYSFFASSKNNYVTR